MEDLRKTYDVCLVVLNVSGFAQYNTMRVKWAQPADQPWYVSELPTVFLSLNFTNHLIDVPDGKDVHQRLLKFGGSGLCRHR